MKVFNGDFAEPLKKIISEWTPIIYVITQKSILNISQTEARNVFQNKKLFTDGWQQMMPILTSMKINSKILKQCNSEIHKA